MSDAQQLALITPSVANSTAFKPLLEEAMRAARVASVHLRVLSADEADVKRALQALGPLIQERGAALLVDPPADFRNVARWGADGVHLSQPALIKDALQALKPDRAVGVGGLRSRDTAMSAGEDGCDYVMFGEPRTDGSLPPLDQVTERCQWWAEVFTTPCIGYAASLEAVAPLAATGVEFIALGEWLFSGSASEVAERLLAAERHLKA
jgi:thiamine-phosphate pyrophosphorylase